MKEASFGAKIKALRTDLDLKQSDVAEKLGISQSVYGNYEQGKRNPDFETLVNICVFYQVSADYLLGVPTESGCFSALSGTLRSMHPADQQRVCEYAEMLCFYRKHKK
ncbi:helix-turn-helix domain-containing protein [Caproiciproducens sp. CPB-2]|uniref:helix-turn-helix domain-containing protein n=1 Tax=Caproiciproducens sp. CPB-2 TaxID=3030017 RepID=UPI0023DC13D7|nr:helix-turn-helix transcriptional regulator [Caproiciproducens sp. CPB-2]MDF1493263.1 helix-turn-helix transcriptional regulator [Caproiciproducens sp. CPB-2]